ncbi:MAG: hypothetical protein U9R08_04135 [Nanoarchaeota archaeon]|nr:hypothetical protein [Nanoarchaeota archaeon]
MLETLLDVNNQLVQDFKTRFGNNLAAIIGYGSFFQEGLDTKLDTLTKEHFNPNARKCIKPDFILIYEYPDNFFEALGEQAQWDETTKEKQKSLNTTISYYNLETEPVEANLDEPKKIKIPYKIGVISLAEVHWRSFNQTNLYLAGRLSKVIYPQHIDPESEDFITACLQHIRGSFIEKALDLTPEVFTFDKVIENYVKVSYLAEAFRGDYFSKPKSILEKTGNELKQMLLPVFKKHLTEHPEIKTSEPIETSTMIKPIRPFLNKVSTFFQYLNHNYHSLCTTMKQARTNNSVGGDSAGYVWRKIKKIVS